MRRRSSGLIQFAFLIQNLVSSTCQGSVLLWPRKPKFQLLGLYSVVGMLSINQWLHLLISDKLASPILQANAAFLLSRAHFLLLQGLLSSLHTPLREGISGMQALDREAPTFLELLHPAISAFLKFTYVNGSHLRVILSSRHNLGMSMTSFDLSWLENATRI
jgi:hypothetical protein